MKTQTIITLILFLISTSLNIYLYIRQRMARKFMLLTIYLCYKWDKANLNLISIKEENSAFYWLYNNCPSYTKLVFSFKPLKLEYWYDKKDLEKLFNKHTWKN